jgi:hypothetical protein
VIWDTLDPDGKLANLPNWGLGSMYDRGKSGFEEQV